MRRAARCRLLAVCLGVAPFVLLEVGLRARGWSKPPLEMPIVLWNKLEDEAMEAQDSYFQRDEHSLWSLRPGAVVQFAETDRIEAVEHINADGMRGPRVPKPRTSGVLRIATLGDSSTFGVGVRCEETFTERLSTLLESRGVAAEVLNGGVDGFTVRQGVERWRALVSTWKPDVVIAAFGAVNEHWGALNFMTDDEKLALLQEQSHLGYVLRRRLLDGSRAVQYALHVADPDARKRFADSIVAARARSRELAQDAGEVDWDGKRRVSLHEFRDWLRVLEREVEAQGARLILVSPPRRQEAELTFPVLARYSASALHTAKAEELQVLDARRRFHALLESGRTEDELFIDDFWHPNATGHGLIAEWLVPLVLDPALDRGRDAHLREE